MMNKASYLIFGFLGVISLSAYGASDETRQKAEQGDYIAQQAMGIEACKNGDYYSALDWYERAAKQAYGKTDQEWQQHQLAVMYYDGKCIGASYEQGSPNYPKALEWYSKLAYNREPKDLSRHYNAKLYVARIYWLGEGNVKKEGAIARRLFDELANLPDHLIQVNEAKGVIQEIRGNARLSLALMYYRGDFVAQDDALAYQWADKSRNDGSTSGAVLQAVMLYHGRGVKQNKANATDLMARVCNTGQSEYACESYKKMKAGLPIRY